MKLDGHHMISHMEFYSSPSKGLEFIRIFGAEIDGHEEIKYIECGSEPADKDMIETILVNDCDHDHHQDTYHEHCVLEYINSCVHYFSIKGCVHICHARNKNKETITVGFTGLKNTSIFSVV